MVERAKKLDETTREGRGVIFEHRIGGHFECRRDYVNFLRQYPAASSLIKWRCATLPGGVECGERLKQPSYSYKRQVRGD